MSELSISVRGLGKRFRLGHRLASPRTWADRLRALATRAPRPPTEASGSADAKTFWAVRDVTVDIGRGEAIGLIGRNGSGKSTLLRVLSRITEPTEGYADIYGRVASLLEVGTGMHPELTGRENIYLNGCILGMRRREIRARFDEIVDFAGIGKFIDTPVKRYSSGMRVRLGFSIASQLETQILLVDEVLAVGDAEFQKRCLGRMRDVAGSGRTVLFVSHDMGAVRALTSRCLYMSEGRLVAFERTGDIVDRYLHDALDRASDRVQTYPLDFYRRTRADEAGPTFAAVRVGPGDRPMPRLAVGDPITFQLDLVSDKSCKDIVVSIELRRESGDVVCLCLSRDVRCRLDVQPGMNRVQATIKGMRLMPGRYYASLGASSGVGAAIWDAVQDYPAFDIANVGDHALILRPDRPGAVYWSECDWQCEAAAASGAQCDVTPPPGA